MEIFSILLSPDAVYLIFLMQEYMCRFLFLDIPVIWKIENWVKQDTLTVSDF
jgi:hypothetical protein